ncbi:MAG: hypothetical protein N2170_07890 [Bacteroidia bacterium]|nr:hypothetical protein [Bacteroidia bacterium]
MKHARLSSDALWRVLRVLKSKERHRIQQRVENTRWKWLMEVLLQMEEYSDERLREAYRAAFPHADDRLLRVYKRQMWNILEEVLAVRDTEGIEEEVQLWQRLWLSVILWRRGESETAEVIWLQVMQAAVEKSWYEMALWGLMLLEMYSRDFHRFAPGALISDWSRHLLELIQARYSAITRKIAASETYVASRMRKGWSLPHLPEKDPWERYMTFYEELILAARDSDYRKALDRICSILEIIIEGPSLLRGYFHFYEMLAWTNLGIVLLNLGAWDLYEKWYETWQVAWRSERWPCEERFEGLHRIVLALRMGHLIKTQRWHEARKLYDSEKREFEKHIFDSSENVGFRLSSACSIYLTLLLLPKTEREPIRWRLRVETWIEKEDYRDSEYLWWTFLRWFEAYLSTNGTWIRHWNRRLRQVWKMYFDHDKRWLSLLKLLRSLTEGTPSHWRRNAHKFMVQIRSHQEEYTLWENDSVIFPMPLFVEAILQGKSLLDMRRLIERKPSLSDEQVQRVENLLYSLLHSEG